MIEIPTSPRRSENMDRYPCRNRDELPCACCGKPVKFSSPTARWLHMWYGADAVTEDEAKRLTDEEGSGGDTGAYPVGPECVRKYPQLRPYLHKSVSLA